MSITVLGAKVGALAGLEARRLLASPIVLVGLMVSVGVIIDRYTVEAPVRGRLDATMPLLMLPLAGAMLLATNRAALRGNGWRGPALFEAMPTTGFDRLRAVAAAGILVAGGVSLVVVTGVVVATAGPLGVGRRNFIALADALAVVVVGALAGVAMARWVSSAAAAPAAIVTGAIVQLLATPDIEIGEGGRLPFRWIAPALMPSSTAPVELQALPHGWHLVLLIGMGCLLYATLKSRERSPYQAIGFGVASVALVAAGVMGQYRTAELSDPYTLLGDPTRCQEVDRIQYCSYEGFEGWVPAWHQTIGRGAALLATPVTKVLQKPSDVPPGGDADLYVSLSWDGIRSRGYAFNLALDYALVDLGLPAGPVGSEKACSAAGQARGVIALWYAAVISQDEGFLRSRVQGVLAGNDREDVLVLSAGRDGARAVDFSVADGLLALDILDLDPRYVTETLRAHPQLLAGPDADSTELARMLGVAPPRPPRDGPWRAAACP